MSPLLFTVYTDDLKDWMKKDGEEEADEDERFITLKYADDILIFAKNQDEVARRARRFIDWCRRKRLNMNLEKSEVWRRKEEEGRRKKQHEEDKEEIIKIVLYNNTLN